MPDEDHAHPGPARLRAAVVVADPARLARTVSALAGDEIEVREVDSIVDLRDPAGGVTVDLIITDGVGPDGAINDELDYLLARRDVPVVIVASSDVAGVAALEAGAADYVVEPVSLRELRARALLRAGALAPTVLEYGGLRIDLAARRVSLDGVVLDLAPREYDMLVFLAERPGQVVTRKTLLEEVWGTTPEWRDVATVTEHVYRLRRRIEVDPSRPRRIVTVRSVGYRFDG